LDEEPLGWDDVDHFFCPFLFFSLCPFSSLFFLTVTQPFCDDDTHDFDDSDDHCSPIDQLRPEADSFVLARFSKYLLRFIFPYFILKYLTFLNHMFVFKSQVQS